MNQFGMQMPGARSRKAEWSTIYTVMLFVACCALIAACAVMYQVSSSVGVDGQPWQMQQVNNIRLPAAT